MQDKRSAEDSGNKQSSFSKVFEDKNLRFPSHPRIVADLDVFEVPDGLGIQFRGLTYPVTIRGSDLGAVRFLLSAMDGATDLDSLFRLRPEHLPLEAVHRAFFTLHERGLLTSGKKPVEAISLADRERLFWDRNVGYSRNASDYVELPERLKYSHCTLLLSGMVGVCTADLLKRVGLNRLSVFQWEADDDVSKCLEDLHISATVLSTLDDLGQLSNSLIATDLLIVALRVGSDTVFEHVNDLAIKARSPWLRCNVESTSIDFGPLVIPKSSGCYSCARYRQMSSSPFAVEHREYQNYLETTDAGFRKQVGELISLSSLAASTICEEVVRLLTRVCPPVMTNMFARYDLATGQWLYNRFLQVPRCTSCIGLARV